MKQAIPILILLLMTAPAAPAQKEPEAAERSFGDAAAAVQKQLQETLDEYNALQKRIENEKVPLNRQLKDLENELLEVRAQYQETSRRLDTRTLDLSNLRNEIKTRREEATYLSNLLAEYIRNFESRLHIAELQRYKEPLEAARLAPENKNLSQEAIYRAQTGLLNTSLERLHEVLGGTRFKGTAVDAGGMVKPGTFVLVGPAAVFRSEDGRHVGSAEQRIGSLEPAVIPYSNPEDVQAAAELVAEGRGEFPLDPTLGNAHKIESTEETLVEHIAKGGPVMYPILAMAGAATLVALYKWIRLALVRKPSPRGMRHLLAAIKRHDDEAVRRETDAIRKARPRVLHDVVAGGAVGALLGYAACHLLRTYRPEFMSLHLDFLAPKYHVWFLVGAGGVALGLIWHLMNRIFARSPVGEMLAIGVEHRREPRELIEEVMYEHVLSTRLKLQRLLPFVAIAASSAPLLGLLGTVTGIINTFKLITVFGSGDVKTLSGGISEALITTEFGLIVAIPSLLMYAFLSRKARGVVGQMEKAAVAVANEIGKSPFGHTGEIDADAGGAEPSAEEPPDDEADEEEGALIGADDGNGDGVEESVDDDEPAPAEAPAAETPVAEGAADETRG
jgi:Skp family chaperone for outer membrane proteins